MNIEDLDFAELPPELVTGIDSIDKQHVALITIITHFSACALEGCGKEQLVNIMKFLDGYVTVHLENEEKYMKKYDYFALEDHLAQHDIFRKYVKELKERIQFDNPVLHVKAASTLKEWLLRHVGKSDILMAKHIRASVEAHKSN